MNALDYEFQDLNLVTDLGFGFVPLTGIAEISFDRSGEWTVTDIRLEGSRENKNWLAEYRKTGKSSAYQYKWQSLCRKSYPWLFDAIVDALEKQRSAYIQDRVSAEIMEAA